MVVLVEPRLRRSWGGGDLAGVLVMERERERKRRVFLKRYEVGTQTMEVNQSVGLSRVGSSCE